jgi:hypothetical protein
MAKMAPLAHKAAAQLLPVAQRVEEAGMLLRCRASVYLQRLVCRRLRLDMFNAVRTRTPYVDTRTPYVDMFNAVRTRTPYVDTRTPYVDMFNI